MSKFFYFKVTFISTAAGLFAGMLVYGLFDINFSNDGALTKWLLKSLVTAVVVGLVMAIINMFFKVGTFRNQEK